MNTAITTKATTRRSKATKGLVLEARTDNPAAVVDEALVARAKAGCTDSFDELARRWRPRLVAALWKRTGSEADAEDVAQDALVRAHEKLHLHDGKYRFSTWLFTIAFRLDISRRRKVKPTVSLGEYDAADAKQPTPAEASARREANDNLWAVAERKLSEPYYTALWLRYGEDMPPNEIARVMKKTTLAVRVMLHRARRGLAPHVAELAGVTTDNPKPAMKLSGGVT